MEKYIWTAAALVASFAISLILGKFIIPALRRLKLGQHIREVGPNWHRTKEGTPMMGGFIFIGATLITVLALSWKLLGSELGGAASVLFLALSGGVIGFLDDYEKMKKKQNLGLSVIQKLVLQFAVAIVFLTLLKVLGVYAGEIYVPFLNVTWQPHWIISYAVSAVFIVLVINAVNLTDGIDGLCTGVTIPVGVFFAAASLMLFSKLGLSVLSASLVGALCGFLVYNFNPAKVFMGDTGSLFLGGMVAGLAYALRMPLALLLVGFVYLFEALSVVLQVGCFKLTHGKRIFKMAPFHHHLELCGWGEKKIFTVATLLTAALCALAFWGVLPLLTK